VGPLAIDRQTAAVTEASIAAKIHQTLDVELNLTAEVALHLVVGVENVADELDLGIRELLDALVFRDIRLFANLASEGAADSVEVRKGVGELLSAGKIDTSDTSHRRAPSCLDAAYGAGFRR
jgi:hypothetical protein